MIYLNEMRQFAAKGVLIFRIICGLIIAMILHDVQPEPDDDFYKDDKERNR